MAEKENLEECSSRLASVQDAYVVPSSQAGSVKRFCVRDIKVTAALLRSRKEPPLTSHEEQRQPLVEMKVPNIIATAKKLRSGSPGHDSRISCGTKTSALAFSEVRQTSCGANTTTQTALGFSEVRQTSFRPVFRNPKCDRQGSGATCEGRCASQLFEIESRRLLRTSRLCPKYGVEAKSIIRKVREFFEELKVAMAGTCARVIFQHPRKLTASACGVSEDVVKRIPEDVHQAAKKSGASRRPPLSKKQRRQRTLDKYGEEWGEKVKQAIHGRLRNEEDVTITELHSLLQADYNNFCMSRTTLYELVRALGFSYRMNDDQKIIYQRADLIQKRSRYLQLIEEARERGDCLIYTDETWIFSGMVKPRGWNDNNIPRFAPKEMLEKYSCGRSVGKNKGVRAIVIGAMAEDGVIPGCTRMVICGKRNERDDYHEDMNHVLFEEWLEHSIPHMKNWAGEKRVTLIMDNASYHSRQITKIPNSSSTKAEIAGFLSSKGVTVRNNVTKAVLLEQLHDYIEARGGRDALREYAVDRRCAELGVNLIRLPPFHCTFNPIEKCWSQLKAHLTKYGKVTDKIDTVRERAVQWMRSVPPSFTSAWFRFARREEAAARSKQEIDRAEESSSDDTYDSSEEVEEEEDQEEELE